MTRNVFNDWMGFVGLLVLGSVGCSSVDSVDGFKKDGVEFNCAVGDVTAHEAMVWMKTENTRSVVVQYTTDPLWASYQESLPDQSSETRDFTVHVGLSNLQPGTRYFYRMIIPGEQPGTTCQFLTAPLPGIRAPVTFVIGGDTRHGYQPFSIMHTMQGEKPDFFIFLGDTIYADKETPARELQDYWAKYKENRDEFTKHLLAETSLYVIWDDHEVDSDFISTNTLMPVGRQAFFDYWPIRPNDEERGRLYRSFTWGKGVEIFLLDTRQYRNPDTHTMLGAEQKQWLLQQLEVSQATFKFILSSVPFSDPRKDKWGEYPRERDEILRFIREREIPGVLFLAGDVHHGAVSRMPGFDGMKELIFGPLAARMNYKISPNEPRFDFFYQQTPNYGKITVNPDETNPTVQIEWLDERHRLIHREILDHNQYDSSTR